jgi:sigma-B regulation protein RsbU (phosphoserine phosphatase)
MCFVVVDLRNGRMLGANAGHHPVIVVSEDGVRTLLGASAPPTGLLPGIEWRDEEGVLRPGETLVMYTDGIVEARAGSTQGSLSDPIVEYEAERLEQVAHEHHSDSPRDLINAVMLDVDDYSAPLSPHDDCTMIALRYLHDGK